MTAVSSDIVFALQKVARLDRSEIFSSSDKCPISSPEHAAIAAPGWVGKDWKPGSDLFLGINPGGGSDRYRVNENDGGLYAALGAFNASIEDEVLPAFVHYTTVWIDAQESHKLTKLIDAVLAQTNRAYAEVAFLNLVPFRTRNNVEPSQIEKSRSLAAGVGELVEALAPGRIIALGRKSFDFIVKQSAMPPATYLPRTNGDNYISEGAKLVISEL